MASIQVDHERVREFKDAASFYESPSPQGRPD